MVNALNWMSVVLDAGLNIEGRLVINGTNHVALKTPFIFNQGVFTIRSTSPKIQPYVSSPHVEIILTGSSNQYLLPHWENMRACGMVTGCHVGVRPIVTAGGKLDVHSFPQGCSTWQRIKSVDSSIGDPNSYDILQVENASAARCWGEGGKNVNCGAEPASHP